MHECDTNGKNQMLHKTSRAINSTVTSVIVNRIQQTCLIRLRAFQVEQNCECVLKRDDSPESHNATQPPPHTPAKASDDNNSPAFIPLRSCVYYPKVARHCSSR